MSKTTDACVAIKHAYNALEISRDKLSISSTISRCPVTPSSLFSDIARLHKETPADNSPMSRQLGSRSISQSPVRTSSWPALLRRFTSAVCRRIKPPTVYQVLLDCAARTALIHVLSFFGPDAWLYMYIDCLSFSSTWSEW